MSGLRWTNTSVRVIDRHGARCIVRCIFIHAGLGVTEEVGSAGSLLGDDCWRVIHLASGGAMPTSGLTAAMARRLLLAVAPLIKWERLSTIESVAALGKRTKRRIRRVIDETLEAAR